MRSFASAQFMVHRPKEHEIGLKREIEKGLHDENLTIKRKEALFIHHLQKCSNMSNKGGKLTSNLGNKKQWTVKLVGFAENFQRGVSVSAVQAKQDNNKSRLWTRSSKT